MTDIVHSLQANHRIPEIKISPVSESENSFSMVLRQEYEDRWVAREKVKLVVATMTENFHADHNKHGDSVDNTAKQEFESDQSSVWDVIKIGEDLLKQVCSVFSCPGNMLTEEARSPEHAQELSIERKLVVGSSRA